MNLQSTSSFLAVAFSFAETIVWDVLRVAAKVAQKGWTVCWLVDGSADE